MQRIVVAAVIVVPGSGGEEGSFVVSYVFPLFLSFITGAVVGSLLLLLFYDCFSSC